MLLLFPPIADQPLEVEELEWEMEWENTLSPEFATFLFSHFKRSPRRWATRSASFGIESDDDTARFICSARACACSFGEIIGSLFRSIMFVIFVVVLLLFLLLLLFCWSCWSCWGCSLCRGQLLTVQYLPRRLRSLLYELLHNG